MTRISGPIDSVLAGLRRAGYLADTTIGTVVHLATELGKPVLVEGPAGTGKTQLAKSVALAAGKRLIRLQCYEGLDESKAIYEWTIAASCCSFSCTTARRRRAWATSTPRRPSCGSDPCRACWPAWWTS